MKATEVITPNVSHLMIPWVQHCVRCGHAAVGHWGTPGCAGCACVWDPICHTCGKLTSAHDLPPDDEPYRGIGSVLLPDG